MELDFRPTPAFTLRYQKLLGAEWTADALLKAYDLVVDQLGAAGLRLVFPEDDDPEDRPSLYPIPPSASDDLREHLEGLNYRLNLQHAERRAWRARTAADRRLERLAVSVSYLLAFPAWPVSAHHVGEHERLSISGDPSLFDDARSILYLCAVHDLLPQLEAQKWQRARGLMLHSLHTHAQLVWGNFPAHQHYLFSLFFEAIGDVEQASQSLLRAFTSTSPHEHDYFTRAFNYWAYEMERDQVDSAIEFALRLYREAPAELIPDAERLVRDSFDRLHVRRRPGP